MRTKYIMAFLQVEYKDLCKELLLFAPPDSRIAGIISEIFQSNISTGICLITTTSTRV